jgi:predicted NBD/HSP70 family sugar kinase
MAKRNSPVIGVDVGGTKILAALVDGDGNIVKTAKISTARSDS